MLELTGPKEMVLIGVSWSAGLLTLSLSGIHVRADVHNIKDLATKLSNIPSTFLRDFLSPEEFFE